LNTWEETPGVTFSGEEKIMMNLSADNTYLILSDYLNYRGYVNDWNRVVDENGEIYFLKAW
jgi:hypothetical protein